MSGSTSARGHPPSSENNDDELAMDHVLATQPELGPSIPDGGYGWVVFIITLFFQSLIPSLLTSFGMFLPFSRITSPQNTIEGNNPLLWDNNILHVPLFFIASWTFLDSTIRNLIAYSTWPKLFATAGTCLTCAGLLFLWMGITGSGHTSLFVLSGIFSGTGASVQMAQCEIILSQYFRLKLPVLMHLSHAVSALGFIFAPIVVGHKIINYNLTQIILWYQAIILQGLILNLLLRKPTYLKSKSLRRYNYVSTSPDDEEDIFSKNSRELQIKIQNHYGTQIQRHEIAPQENSSESQPSTSNQNSQNWVVFNQENDTETVKQWETFEENKDGNGTQYPLGEGSRKTKKEEWETFEDDPTRGSRSRTESGPRNQKSLHLELSFGKSDEISIDRPSTRTTSGLPIPLFTDTPVNNNNTYSYDVLEDRSDAPQSMVFPPTLESFPAINRATTFSRTTIEFLRQPTFYKSLVTVITTRWSLFVFFALYPSFLYQEVHEMRLRQLSNLVGSISIATLIFAFAAFWINIDKRWRPKTLWILCWIGALGYFMISDYFTEGVLLFGAVQIVLSIAALQHVGSPLLGLTVKGESTKEYNLICFLTGLSFLLFLVINASFKDVFRMMALLNFFTGALWLSNYIYKRLVVR